MTVRVRAAVARTVLRLTVRSEGETRPRTARDTAVDISPQVCARLMMRVRH